MIGLARTDTSLIGRWWWTVDRWTLAALAVLICIGAVMTTAASPPVAEHLGLGEFHFVQRHIGFVLLGTAVMVGLSLLSPRGVRAAAALLLLGSLVAVALTLVVGAEIKGATRWLHLPGMSIQPSEFVKPAFAVIAAWLFARALTQPGVPGRTASTLLCLVIVALLLNQPDLGMAVVICAVWGAQFFLAGLPLILVFALGMLAICGLVGSYFAFPHVAARIDGFLDPTAGNRYQVDRAMEAFMHGGLWGAGPGEGRVKFVLPDAHADFIFAVAGEEFGLLWCLVIVALFGAIVLRGLYRIATSHPVEATTPTERLFCLIAAAGLLAQFGVQALINMGSTLHLIPTKGMTLPFVSYGGSSVLALSIGMGFLLALTRSAPADSDRLRRAGPAVWTPHRVGGPA